MPTAVLLQTGRHVFSRHAAATIHRTRIFVEYFNRCYRHVANRISTASIRELMDEGLTRLSSSGISSPRRDVEWLLCEALGVGRAELYARLNEAAGSRVAEMFREMLERRRLREPVQHIVGYTEFYGMRLDVSSNVLIPRPETEQVVEEAIRTLTNVSAPRVLDVGTGSGCMALAIKSERPDAEVWASDISEAALAVATRNASRHRMDVQFMSGDVFAQEFRDRAPRELDLLISNPPYISTEEAPDLPPEVREFEPHVALFAPSDPLIFYRGLADLGMYLLGSARHIVLETHSDHGHEAKDILRRTGYKDVVLKCDYADRPRILRGVSPKSS